MPRQLPEAQPRASDGVNQRHVSVEPSGSSRSSPADDADAIEDADRVQPVGAVHVVEDAVADADEAIELADVAGLLGQLAQDGDLRRFAEIEAAAGQRPYVADPDRRRDVAEQDPAGVVVRDGIGGDTRRPTGAGSGLPRHAASPAHGASSDARKRGSSPREAGTRSPITRPIVARTSGRAASRRAAYSKGAGPGEERLDEPRDGVLGGEPAAHGPVVGRGGSAGPGGSVQRRADRGRRELGRDEGAVEALAGERIEETDRVPDQEPARSGPAGHATAEGRGAGERGRIARRRASRGVVSAAGTAATTASAVAAAPSRASRSRHDGPSTIPMFTRRPGTGAIPM